MATPQTVIRDLMRKLDYTVLDGTAALDEAISAISKFSSWSELTKTLVQDCKAYNGDYAAFLKDMCDIVLDNEDTGAITGADAGTHVTKNAESIVPETGDITYPESNVFEIQGLTVTVPELDTLSASEKFIVGALYTWWIDASLTLINNSFNMNFKESGTTIKEMDVTFYDKDDGRTAYTSYSTSQKSDELHLTINMHYYNSLDTADPNGKVKDNTLTYLDRTIAHEMVHAVMAANVDWFNDLPLVFKEGIAELVHGIDDKRRTAIQNLATNSSSLQSALNRSYGTEPYAAGYIALRYFAKQVAAGRDPADAIEVDNSDDSSTTDTSTTIITPVVTETTVTSSVTVSGTTLLVKGEVENDIWISPTNFLNGRTSKYANPDVLTIDATQLTGCIILAGNDNNNTIKSGSNGASIWGGLNGDDSLIGGDSRDVFFYCSGGGDDTVQNFTAGVDSDADVLAVAGNFSISRAGSDLACIMDDGGVLAVSLTSDVDRTIQYTSNGASPIPVKVGNTGSGNSFTYEKNIYYVGGNAADTLNVYSTSFSNSVDLSDEHFWNINVIDAKLSTAKNYLAGNNLDNQIIAGSGGSTLWGGASTSNDVLTGGNGADMFRFGKGEGNDVVNNASANDTVNFYNVTIEDLVSIEYLDSGLKINLSAGSLTVNTTENLTPALMIADGSSYRYDRETNTWSTAE